LGKLKLAILLLCVLLVSAVVGAAIKNIISPPVTVTVEEYVLTLTVNATTCLKGDTLKFNGTLTINGDVITDQTIKLYCDGVDTGLSDLTDTNGYYEIIKVMDTVGTFTFYTNTTIP